MCLLNEIFKTGNWGVTTMKPVVITPLKVVLKKPLDQDNVGPDVITSLVQSATPNDEAVSEEKELSVESDLEEGAIPEKSVEKSQTEEGSISVDEESDSDEKDSAKDVVDVDKIGTDEDPLEPIIVDSAAKRLRSNKGKVVPTFGKIFKKSGSADDETPKNKTKMTSVGPKKSRSKVMVKSVAGSSKKRKVVSSSESEYDVEMDNITPPESKKADRKKELLIVEYVPIDKVSFHLPSFAQRWKFIYHRRLALKRDLSEEALKI